ncbi:transcription factor FAMA-like [Telopea speciosissima]|uniref:transcription factor FAMA-like n=1 Tax=Telopea speciosissima TaxID=54955 RepID=UPI001CC5D520|nr:transcription factor FAMA-like [Telopea speciosissima]
MDDKEEENYSVSSHSIHSYFKLFSLSLSLGISVAMFYLEPQLLQASFTPLDYTLDHHYHHQQQQQQLLRPFHGENSNAGMVDYMLSNPPPQQASPAGFCSASSSPLDRLSFADVMQFADFGPKLALNQTKIADEETEKATVAEEEEREEEEEGQVSENTLVQRRRQLRILQKSTSCEANKIRRKRSRTIKTSEEVQSQRMTHIAVERNRRKQMNEHLRVLRSLMPGSYVQRGDQASIIGGAIEFVRELEQLLQCLESKKRRRLYGSGGEPPLPIVVQSQPSFNPPMFLPNDQIKIADFDTGFYEETAENKSYLADVEVKLLGFDAMIKILSRRRHGQLLETIAALEDLNLDILHTNITTIEQTVLYSFNVKVSSESRFTADDIANSVQQIFIHASSITTNNTI